MADDGVELVVIENPRRVDHVLKADGWLGLEIEADHPGTPSGTTVVRVTLSHADFFRLQASLEASRQQFGLPLPAVFSQQQTRQ
jgi:hypothetical protein